MSTESGAVAMLAASIRSSGGFVDEALMSFLVASKDSKRSCRVEGRWKMDSSSSSSACDSPLVNGGVADWVSSSSARSGAGVFLLSDEGARDSGSFSGTFVAGAAAGDFVGWACGTASVVVVEECDAS